MKRPVKQIYALAVCFATLLCFVVALGIGLYNVVQICAPTYTISAYSSQAYESNEKFVHTYEDKKGLPTEELTKLRESLLEDAIFTERQSAVQSLIQVVILIVIDIVVFVVHWHMAKRAELHERETTAVV
jgi:hypothetical protein